MMNRLRQIWCRNIGHPYPITTVPIIKAVAGAPLGDVVEVETTFCTGCGATLKESA
jgi:hypothetical protein